MTPVFKTPFSLKILVPDLFNSEEIKRMKTFYPGTFTIEGPDQNLSKKSICLLLHAKFQMDQARFELTQILDPQKTLIHKQTVKDHLHPLHNKQREKKLSLIEKELQENVRKTTQAFEKAIKETCLRLTYKEPDDAPITLLKMDQTEYRPTSV